MTQEEHREYSKRYREEGYGKNADWRYRVKHAAELREKNRLRMRLYRKNHRSDAED